MTYAIIKQLVFFIIAGLYLHYTPLNAECLQFCKCTVERSKNSILNVF